MKNIKNILFLITLSLLIVQPTYSQNLLKRISNRAVKQAEERLEKKANEKVDKELDKAEDKLVKDSDDDESNSSSSGLDVQGIMKNLGIAGEPVPIADNYEFDHLIQMHIESFNDKGKKTSEGEFITHLNTDSKCMAYQSISGDMAKDNKGMFILDMENEAMIMLSDDNGEKNGIVYGIKGFMQSMGETYDEVELEDTPETYLANPNVKKTGRTKTIAGLKCEEFKYNDEYSESEIWITKDVKMNTKDFFSTIFKTSMYSHGMGWGYMMEATTTSKENGDKSFMQVTKVDANSNVKYSLSDYKITNLGSFQAPQEE